MSGTGHSFEMEAVIFDLDGVVTRTADLHAAAWKETFDTFLERWAAERSTPFVPFDLATDYLAYVDGRPRFEGVRTFLRARGIVVPDPAADDEGGDLVLDIGERKNDEFLRRLRRDGVTVYPSTIALVEELRRHRIRTGLVTSSRNGREILEITGTAHLFEAVIDGTDLDERTRGKPHPDAFTRCAELLDVTPSHAVVVEDAVTGVAAARRGNFGLVLGVNRGDHHAALEAHGADFVVDDLAEVDARSLDVRFRECREEAAWHVEQEGFDPVREHAMESLFTVGNGYVGVRGSPDTLWPGSQGDLFVAGVYDRKHVDRPYSEHEFLNIGGDSLHAELVSAPFPFRLRLSVDDLAIDAVGAQTRSFRRTLDLHTAVPVTEMRFAIDDARAVTMSARRCASAAERHLLLQEITIHLENHAGTVELDATLRDPDLATSHPHLVPLPARAPAGIEVHRYRTQASGYEICIATRVTLAGAGRDSVYWQAPAAPGKALTFRRYVAVYSSRDVDDPVATAVADLEARSWDDFDGAWRRHEARWAETWRHADVRIGNGYPTEQALRFNSYHLQSTAARAPHVSIGARALSGRAYEGHIFWDVEIFMLPFYLHTDPAVARNALMYRHYTLDGARQRARDFGYRGACYAWESTVTGEDVTPRTIRLKTTGREIPIFTGTQQIHVTADVAYGVWRYWDATHDHEFMRDYGAEILFETARFWVSRSTRGPRYHHIRGVVGPDEYHHSVNDNAYTNWMARFNLQQALAAAAWMQREWPGAWGALCERLDLVPAELGAWREVAGALYCAAPDKRGVIEQFEGFFDLEDYPLPAEERLQAPVHRLFDWDRINRLKLIKQADMLMLPFLFPQAFTDGTLAANYDYYEPLTDHGSSLSPAVHAALAARLGRREAARRYWRQSLWLDLSNVMTNSSLGVHPACMGGTWQALMFGFLGLRFDETGPVCAEDAARRLPDPWRSVSTRLLWRGRSYPVEVTR